MHAFWTLVRREITSFFTSWTGYIIMAGVAFLLGFSFSSMLTGLNGEESPLPVTQLFYETLYFWQILLAVAPIVTMRSFALEKASGTYETLMTSPVGDAQVVLAKYSGALIFFLLLWLPLPGVVLIVRYYSHDPSVFDPGALGATFFGIFLIGSIYVAMGIFASAATRSQIIAVMFSFALGITLFMLSFLTSAIAINNSWQARLVSHLSLMEHMRDLAQGIVDSRPIVVSLSLTTFFLYLTWKMVQSRRWK